MLGFNSQATEYLLSHIWDSHQTERLEEGDGKGNGKGMWLSGEKGTRGSRAAGRKDELRGSCFFFFFAGTPAKVEARMASNGFFTPALFISRPRFLRHIGPQSQGGFSCGMITQQRHFTSDIRGQQFPSRWQQAGLFTRKHCSRCGGQIQATVFVFLWPDRCFSGSFTLRDLRIWVFCPLLLLSGATWKLDTERFQPPALGETHWAYESERSRKKQKQATWVETHSSKMKAESGFMWRAMQWRGSRGFPLWKTAFFFLNLFCVFLHNWHINEHSNYMLADIFSASLCSR